MHGGAMSGGVDWSHPTRSRPYWSVDWSIENIGETCSFSNVSHVWNWNLSSSIQGKEWCGVGFSYSACTLFRSVFYPCSQMCKTLHTLMSISAGLEEGLTLDCTGIKGVLGLNCFCENPSPYFRSTSYFHVFLRITWYTQARSFSDGLWYKLPQPLPLQA